MPIAGKLRGMNEHIVAIIVATVTFAIGPVMVAWVTRKANHRDKDRNESPDDNTAEEMMRSNRSLGERLHSDTQGLIRNVERNMHERFDRTDRQVRDLGDQVRDFMRPPSMRDIVQELKDADNAD